MGSRWTRTYHGELLAEDVVAEAGDEVEQEVAAGDVAVDVQRHPAANLLPLRHHLVPLQPVVPPLQLRAVDGVGDGQRQARRHVAVGQRVRPRQLRQRRLVGPPVPRGVRRVLPLIHAQKQHLQLRRLEDRRTEQPRRLYKKQNSKPCRLISSKTPPQKTDFFKGDRAGIEQITYRHDVSPPPRVPPSPENDHGAGAELLLLLELGDREQGHGRGGSGRSHVCPIPVAPIRRTSSSRPANQDQTE